MSVGSLSLSAPPTVLRDALVTKGSLFPAGIYTDRGSSNCKGVQTGSDLHWTTDANDFAEWGVDLVKVL